MLVLGLGKRLKTLKKRMVVSKNMNILRNQSTSTSSLLFYIFISRNRIISQRFGTKTSTCGNSLVKVEKELFPGIPNAINSNSRNYSNTSHKLLGEPSLGPRGTGATDKAEIPHQEIEIVNSIVASYMRKVRKSKSKNKRNGNDGNMTHLQALHHDQLQTYHSITTLHVRPHISFSNACLSGLFQIDLATEALEFFRTQYTRPETHAPNLETVVIMLLNLCRMYMYTSMRGVMDVWGDVVHVETMCPEVAVKVWSRCGEMQRAENILRRGVQRFFILNEDFNFNQGSFQTENLYVNHGSAHNENFNHGSVHNENCIDHVHGRSNNPLTYQYSSHHYISRHPHLLSIAVYDLIRGYHHTKNHRAVLATPLNYLTQPHHRHLLSTGIVSKFTAVAYAALGHKHQAQATYESYVDKLDLNKQTRSANEFMYRFYHHFLYRLSELPETAGYIRERVFVDMDRMGVARQPFEGYYLSAVGGELGTSALGIDGLVRKKEEDVVRLVKVLIQRGVGVSPRAYGRIISGLVRLDAAWHVGKVITMYRGGKDKFEMHNQVCVWYDKQKPHAATLMGVLFYINAFQPRDIGLFGRALEAFENVEWNGGVYRQVIAFYARNKDWEICVRVWRMYVSWTTCTTIGTSTGTESSSLDTATSTGTEETQETEKTLTHTQAHAGIMRKANNRTIYREMARVCFERGNVGLIKEVQAAFSGSVGGVDLEGGVGMEQVSKWVEKVTV